ncbi:hypothetical protein ASG31_01495 [Chryseobacterium sp. Leaf404]|nr:hypothetical protein ASG31_01495 [Chryseobacterium sp. Leaf404]
MFTHRISGQVSSYSFAQSSGSFTPISGTVLGSATANTTTANLNSNVFPLMLPFSFSFNGISYNDLNVSTNGFITFGTTAPSSTNTTPISNTANYDGAISVWGRDISSFFDINTKSGDISWAVIGSAPSRELVIQWNNFRPNSSTVLTTVYSFSFQIRLRETSNIIKMIYDGGAYLVGNTSISGTTQVGLRGSTAADFNSRLNSTATEYINSSTGVANNSSQAFNTITAIPGMPVSGLIYTYTPPTCWVPQSLTGLTTTTNSADVSWVAPIITPLGYDIYYSTSNTPPTSATTPSIVNVSGTSTTLNSLAVSTVYYVWIRSNCGSGDTSVWSSQPTMVVTSCQPTTITSSTGATVCAGATATLSASAQDASAILNWYDAATAGSNVGTGSSFTTPALTTTTNYWVSASIVSSDMYIGKDTPVSASGNSAFTNYGLVFDAYSPMVIKEVDVYPMGTGTTGTVTINLKNSSGTILDSKTVNVNVTTAGILNTVLLNFTVPVAGANYRLVVDAATGVNNLRREITTGFAYPYVLPGVCSITAASFGANPSQSYYYYLYNWKVAGICESPRTMVTASIDAGCLSTSETDSKNTLKVYPNPFSDMIYLSDASKVKNVKVSDVSGKVLRTISKPEAELRLSELPSGMYILVLEMNDGTVQTIKTIKK